MLSDNWFNLGITSYTSCFPHLSKDHFHVIVYFKAIKPYSTLNSFPMQDVSIAAIVGALRRRCMLMFIHIQYFLELHKAFKQVENANE
jgi:hypothetical protein